MLDHFPTPQEISEAEQQFMMGHASSHHMDILKLAHPWRDYGRDSPVGNFLDAFCGKPF
jgi:hypothetical protein